MMTRSLMARLGLALILLSALAPAVLPASHTAGLAGTWYYTSVTDAAGKETKMNNRESYITFEEDGSYEFYAGHSITGIYSLKGDVLTLMPENRDPLTYRVAFSAGGKTLTLKNEKGGYALERG